MPAQRIASFDFGSNSLKFSLFEIAAERPCVVHEQREYCAIGEDVFASGMISDEKAQEVMEAIERLKRLLRPGDAVAAAATSSFRDASNGEEMARRFSQALNADVPILTGEQEAELLGRGVLLERESKGPATVLDIGGGSVEIIHAQDREIQNAKSYDLGAARLREKFSPVPDDEPPAEASMREMARYIQKKLKHIDPLPEQARLYGSGGGLTTLGGILYGKQNHSGMVITVGQMQQTLQKLVPLSTQQIAEQYEIPLQRARIMIAGLLIAMTAIRLLRKDEITVSWAGLREGLAQQWMDQQTQGAG